MALDRHIQLTKHERLVMTLHRCEQHALAKGPVEMRQIGQWVGGGRQLTDQAAVGCQSLWKPHLCTEYQCIILISMPTILAG